MVTILTLDMGEIPHEPNKKSQLPEKQRRKRSSPKLKKEQASKGSTVAESDVDEVYSYWVTVMRPGRTRVPKLDATRLLKVRAAIADYGVEACKQAIDGCASSDFHMGRNRANKRYDDLELIFRDQAHVEMFLERGENRKQKGDF
jgi:hypothetical protein